MFVMNLATGSCVNSGTLSGPNADNGGYKVQPPSMKFCDKDLIKNVNEIISATPIIMRIQFESVRRNKFRNSFIKKRRNVTRQKSGNKTCQRLMTNAVSFK